MSPHIITLRCEQVTSLTMSMLTKHFLNEIMFLEGDKIPIKGSNDKQNLTRVVISYEIYETR